MSIPPSPIHPEESISQVNYNYEADEDIYGNPTSEVRSQSNSLNLSSNLFLYPSETKVSHKGKDIVIRVNEEDPAPANIFLKVHIAK